MTDKDDTTARDFLTVNEAAKVLRVGRRTVYRLVETGKVPAKKRADNGAFPRRLVEFIGCAKTEGVRRKAHH